MAFRGRLRVWIALAGLIAAAVLVTDAAHNHLWANLFMGCLALTGCLAFLLRLETPVQKEPLYASASVVTPSEPLTAVLDQIPLPLIRFSPAEGFQALNRSARALFQTDDKIVNAPNSLTDLLTRSNPRGNHTINVFGRVYAAGVSEIATPQHIVRLVSLTNIQAEVRMAEATALRDLLRVLSHEIMNSLTPVASLSSTAQRYLEAETSPAAKSAREALDVLSQRASGLVQFVEAYRAMARLPEPVLRPVPVEPLLRDIVRVFEESEIARGVVIDIDVSETCPAPYLDEVLFTQALLNVLTNAAEAVAGQTADPRIRLTVADDHDELRLYVADNGGGLPDSLAQQIFHAFVTTKAGGTGTGLNLARQIALAHGGDLVFLGPDGDWRAVFCFILRLTPVGLGSEATGGSA